MSALDWPKDLKFRPIYWGYMVEDCPTNENQMNNRMEHEAEPGIMYLIISMGKLLVRIGDLISICFDPPTRVDEFGAFVGPP